jgi:putative aldouronate transport system permease protein
MKGKLTLGKFLIYTSLVLLSLSMILPFVRVISVSFSTRTFVEADKVMLLPRGFTLDSYKYVLSEPRIWQSIWITVFVTVVGTVLSLLVTSLMAYSLSRKEFLPARGLMVFVILTMVFQAPLIPFFLAVKALGILNTVWALILPLVVNGFNLIIVRTFFQETPEALIDSGRMDGCGDLRILFNIMLPISKPVIATMALFYAVSYWNIFYNALLFIYDKNLQPLQIIVRSYIENAADTPGVYLDVDYNRTTLQMATILVATIPIIIVYPFLQKYFIKGVSLGAIKE